MRAFAASLALLVAGCAAMTDTAPITQPLRERPARATEEAAIWDEAERFERALAQSKAVVHDDALQKYLEHVTARVYAQLEPPEGITPRVVVVRQPLVNASVAANGVVLLHTGILARIESEAELATLLGHELAHFVRRHTLRERQARRGVERSARLSRALSLGLFEGSGGLSAEIERQVSGYSQQLELEADRVGFEAMAAAGYDERASVRMFEGVLIDEESPDIEDPYYYADHPSMAARAAHYRTLIAGTREPGGELGAERYTEAVQAVLPQNVRDDLSLARVRSAKRGIDRLLARPLPSSEAHFLLGEWLRLTGSNASAQEAAERAYAQATRVDPQSAPAWRALGLVQRDRGRDAEAIQSLEHALALDPSALDRPILEAYLRELKKRAQ